MQVFLFVFEHAINFGVAGIPLILVLLQLKIFRLPLKVIKVHFLLNLVMSVFFWLKLKDITIALYQSIPYISSIICICCENILDRKRGNTGDGFGNTEDG